MDNNNSNYQIPTSSNTRSYLAIQSPLLSSSAPAETGTTTSFKVSSSPPPMTSEGDDMVVESSSTSLLGDLGGNESNADNNINHVGTATAAMGVDNAGTNDVFQEGAPCIDHALLETLFYNEMIAMGDSFPFGAGTTVSAAGAASVGTVDSSCGGSEAGPSGVIGATAAAAGGSPSPPHGTSVDVGGNVGDGDAKGDELFRGLDALTRSGLPSPPPPSLPPTEISMGGLQQQQQQNPPHPAAWTQQQQQQVAPTLISSQAVQQQQQPQVVQMSTNTAAAPSAVVTQPQVASAAIPMPTRPQQTEAHRAVSFALPSPPAPVPSSTMTTTSPAVASVAVPSPTASLPATQSVPSPMSAATTTPPPPPPPASAVSHPSQQSQQQRAKQLVSQFASLAGRLGISLPPSVLNSLTAAAVINESKQSTTATPISGSDAAAAAAAAVGNVPSSPATSSTANATVPATTNAPAAAQATQPAAVVTPASITKSKHKPKSPTSIEASASSSATCATTNATTTAADTTIDTHVNTTVQRLKDTAAEAVAAIDENRRKRTASDSNANNSDDNNVTREQASSSPTNANLATASVLENDTDTTNNATTTSNRPTQYRRRKKPRLQDCEVKLATLRAENATLKRHLEKFANKSHNFDLERRNAEENMKLMIQSGEQDAGKLKGVLDKFTEMYSDYGQHREEELDFHLKQLERLAAPTTITKMSLWTLGQEKRNPIAGILMKELAITPVQARKIIEHRHRIRDLCDNIKQCMALIKRLQSLCKHKQKIFNDRMTKCQEILTPLQVVKLLHWIDEHAGTLESVCPGWGSERIRVGNNKTNDGGTGDSIPVAADGASASATLVKDNEKGQQHGQSNS